MDKIRFPTKFQLIFFRNSVLKLPFSDDINTYNHPDILFQMYIKDNYVVETIQLQVDADVERMLANVFSAVPVNYNMVFDTFDFLENIKERSILIYYSDGYGELAIAEEIDDYHITSISKSPYGDGLVYYYKNREYIVADCKFIMYRYAKAPGVEDVGQYYCENSSIELSHKDICHFVFNDMIRYRKLSEKGNSYFGCYNDRWGLITNLDYEVIQPEYECKYFGVI